MNGIRRIFESATQRKQRLSQELYDLVNRTNVDLQRVQKVLHEGADPNFRLRNYTPFQNAALGGDTASLDAVNLMLAAGANPFIPVEFGLKKYKLSNMIIDRPDIKERLLKAEAEWERVHGPQPPIISICNTPRRKTG
jgi:hypothetical protein